MLRSKLIVCEELKDQLNDLTSAKERLSHEVNDLRRENSRSLKNTCFKNFKMFNFRYPLSRPTHSKFGAEGRNPQNMQFMKRNLELGAGFSTFILCFQVRTDCTQVRRPSRSVLTARASVTPRRRDVTLICSSLTTVGKLRGCSRLDLRVRRRRLRV